MPLTEQEKLLLRIAHYADPIELAMLNPDTRHTQQEGDTADFNRFFPQPPPPDVEAKPTHETSQGEPK